MKSTASPFEPPARIGALATPADGVAGDVPPGNLLVSEGDSGLLGHSGYELTNLQAVRNAPEVINDIRFSGHALDQMQNRGIVPSVVENAVRNGTPFPGNTSTTLGYFDAVNNVRVIVNAETGTVVTVIRGTP